MQEKKSLCMVVGVDSPMGRLEMIPERPSA